MKKISQKLKIYYLRRAKKLRKRHKKRKVYSAKVKANLRAPEVLDLVQNFDESVNFFQKIRNISENLPRHFHVNFKPIRHISASAALILAAEMDRIKRVSKKGILVKNFHQWDSNIRNLLGGMGMYDLLSIRNADRSMWDQNSGEEIFMKFQTGDKANGEDAKKLREIISSAVGMVPGSKDLQKGLTEAMTNVSNHAYPEDFLIKNKFNKKQWWMSASFNNVTEKLTIIFYDQGIGIPETLPKTIREKFNHLIHLLSNDDGKMIEAATKLGRSRTEKDHRGGGLEDIKNYLANQDIENGYFKIYSNRGEFFYKKNGNIEEESAVNKNQKLQGTLIEWQVCIKENKDKVYGN
jgi:anti-sigma regulatory factor (Ser/Thr protein kinase)